MENQIAVVELQAETIAVARGFATWENIPAVVVGLFGVVGHLGEGNQVATYLPTPDGPHIEAGVLVAAPFTDRPPIFCSATPSGLAAMTVHTGSYSGLPEAHRKVRLWAKEHNHELAGLNWENYKHWDADESRLQTAIYYLLK